MGKRLYVGNLPFGITDQDLGSIFAEVGQVVSAKVVMDRETGRSKGFGFVEMNTDEEAAKCISQFNGGELEGRQLKINEAKPMEPRTGGGGGRGGFGGGGGGRGGFGGGGRGERSGGGDRSGGGGNRW
jgi:RNA recognition motif-containing protein